MFWTHRSFWVLPIIVATIFGGLSAIVSHTRLRKVYEHRFTESRRERLFLASLGFFTAVWVVRGLTLAIRYNIGPFHDISMHGRHIHHLVWGICCFFWWATCGWSKWGTGAELANQWMGRLTSMLFGVAAALTPGRVCFVAGDRYFRARVLDWCGEAAGRDI